MSEYIVSARKYRPESFGTLIGQDVIARTLSNSIKRGQLAHAYLFCGPRGVGKTTTARIFAKMINCSNPGEDMTPCGECESCVSFREGRSYCIHELDAASNNSVEDIKALMDQVQVPPPVGKYSVYIIDEVHMLSQSAFNAFLKTLEEPPSHAIFILATTEKHKILPTILSRCQTYDFNRISVSDMVHNLRGIAEKEGVSIDDESLHEIAKKADGAMRDALTIFDQTVAFCGTDVHYEDVIRNLNILDHEYCFSLTENFLRGEYGPALVTFDSILAKGFNALHFVAALSSHFRDLMIARTAGCEALLEQPESLKKRYGEQAARCSLQFLYDALSITTACEAGYKASVNPRLHIEFSIMKLAFLTRGVPAVQPAAQPAAAVAAPAAKVEAPAPKSEAPKPEAPKPEVPQPEAPAPAAKPEAPQPEAPQPEAPQPEAPKPDAPKKRTRAKTGAALSMNSILQEKEDAPAEEAPSESAALPSDEKVTEAWMQLAGRYEAAGKPRLAVMITNTTLRMEEQDGIKAVTFRVTNIAQKTWIEKELLREMESLVRESVGTRRLNLSVEVAPEEPGNKEKVPYMPEEKAKALMDSNPEVREFIASMGLDTK